MPRRKQSLVTLANEAVSFSQAAVWSGITPGGRAKVRCPFGHEHDDGGTEPALRVYDTHGFCFAEQKRFTAVSLLAAVWEVDPEDAAAEALRRAGVKPADYAHLWEQVQQCTAPDRDAMEQALKLWCRMSFPGWSECQYEPLVSEKLSRCLGLLHLCHSELDCRTWLKAAKSIMRTCLSSAKP